MTKIPDSIRKPQQQASIKRGCVVWLTGLSGSGKTTLANALYDSLYSKRISACVLDGDALRNGLCSDLGFSAANRRVHLRRTSEVANLLIASDIIAIVALISPYQVDRLWARESIGSWRFLEVHVSTPLAVCEQRDSKGLYHRARTGDLQNFTGISSPYEAPLSPELKLDTSQMQVSACVAKLEDGIQALWSRLGKKHVERPEWDSFGSETLVSR